MRVDSFEMTDIAGTETGLAMTIWIMPECDGPGCPPIKTPRILVKRDYRRLEDSSGNWRKEVFAVTIKDKPRVYGKTGEIKNEDIDQIKKFILLNKEVLMRFWNEQDPVGLFDVIGAIKKI